LADKSNRRKDGELEPEWLPINTVLDSQKCVTHYVRIFSDIGNQRYIQRNLQQLAYYDTLTGLPNRDLFYDRLTQAIMIARRDSSVKASRSLRNGKMVPFFLLCDLSLGNADRW
jgi:GGDEF domain-containing protein